MEKIVRELKKRRKREKTRYKRNDENGARASKREWKQKETWEEQNDRKCEKLRERQGNERQRKFEAAVMRKRMCVREREKESKKERERI